VAAQAAAEEEKLRVRRENEEAARAEEADKQRAEVRI
jgi:hypothetical protein